MASVDPAARPRRSPLYRELASAGARFADIDDTVVATGFGDDPVIEARGAHELGLCDLTLSPRAGYKGYAAIEWARGHGLVIGDENNRAYPQSDGCQVARLADSEILILGDVGARHDHRPPGGRRTDRRRLSRTPCGHQLSVCDLWRPGGQHARQAMRR